MDTARCTLCGTEVRAKDITHLDLYCIGSEGIEVCLACRMVLTDAARGLMGAAGRGRREGHRKAAGKEG